MFIESTGCVFLLSDVSVDLLGRRSVGHSLEESTEVSDFYTIHYNLQWDLSILGNQFSFSIDNCTRTGVKKKLIKSKYWFYLLGFC